MRCGGVERGLGKGEGLVLREKKVCGVQCGKGVESVLKSLGVQFQKKRKNRKKKEKKGRSAAMGADDVVMIWQCETARINIIFFVN